MGEGEGGNPAEIFFHDVAGLHGQLDTPVGGLSDVDEFRAVADLGGRRHVQQQVGGAGVVKFQGHGQALFEGGEVKAEVVGRGLFPLQFGGVEPAAVCCRGLLAVEEVAAGGRAYGGVGAVCRDGVVAGQTGAQTEREFIQPGGAFHPGLVGDVPLERAGREGRVLVVRGEVGRTVTAYGRGQVVPRVVVPVGAGEHGELAGGGCGGACAVGLLVLHGVHIVPHHLVVHIAAAAQGEVVGPVLVGGKAGHNVQMVLAELHLVGGGVFGGEGILVVLGPVGVTALVLSLGRQGTGVVAVGVPLI